VIPFDISHIKAFPYDYRPENRRERAQPQGGLEGGERGTVLAELRPPFDSPWCFFDTAEARLYLGDPGGFLEWVRKGLGRCEQKWQGETFRSALQLLKDGHVPLDGLEGGLEALDSWIAKAAS
jgi:hypothetical protein